MSYLPGSLAAPVKSQIVSGTEYLSVVTLDDKFKNLRLTIRHTINFKMAETSAMLSLLSFCFTFVLGR